MRAPLPELPETPGELWDFLHERFGFGDYDDIASGEYYWQSRAHEVMKLKAILKRRKVSVAEMAKAGWYVGTEVGSTIRSPFGLLKHVPTAVREWRLAEAIAEEARLDEIAERLIADAVSEGGTKADRLMRMDRDQLHDLARRQA